MARTALRRGLRTTWRPALLAGARPETSSARTLRFEVPGWPGHLAGQHVDLRLTAEDGYTAQRSYSLSAPADGERVEVTVQLVRDGEVSPYLVEEIREGDGIEVLGPLGGWFVWRPKQAEPVLLVGGGSGIVPLVAMLRAREQGSAGAGSDAPFRVLYSVRTPEDVYFADELLGDGGAARNATAEVSVLYTRVAPAGSARPARRIDETDLATHGWPPEVEPTCYVCGPTPFVEAVTTMLTRAGHDPARIRAERFGASGG